MFWFVFFFFFSILLLLLRCSYYPLRRWRRALFLYFFFVHLYYFFSFRRHISAVGSGYVLFIDVLRTAQFSLFFFSFFFLFFFILHVLSPAIGSHRRRPLRGHDGRGVCVYAPRIIMCKKRSQLGRARSPGIPPSPFSSSYHFQQVTNQVFYAVHGSYYSARTTHAFNTCSDSKTDDNIRFPRPRLYYTLHVRREKANSDRQQ